MRKRQTRDITHLIFLCLSTIELNSIALCCISRRRLPFCFTIISLILLPLNFRELFSYQKRAEDMNEQVSEGNALQFLVDSQNSIFIYSVQILDEPVGIKYTMRIKNTRTYSEIEGNRDESFSRATNAIAFVVISELWRVMTSSTTSTASLSVTCPRQSTCHGMFF